MSKKVYTWDEVKMHNKLTDLWIVIEGKVYDLTAFVDEHPGGETVLQEVAGKDGTEAFEEVGHSRSALEDRKKYYIGDVK